MRIRIHPGFSVYLICISVLSSIHVCAGILAALMIHETFHYIACRITGEEIELLELTPWGGVMRYKQGAVPCKGVKGVFVHASGPAGNYAALLLIGSASVRSLWNPVILQSFTVANVSMLLVNLFPAFPLDGGHIIFCLGYYVFPVSRLVRILSLSGVAIGLSGVVLAVYGLIINKMLNCSLLIVSLHMVSSAWKHRRMMLAENIYTVIQERMSQTFGIRKIECYQISPDTTLYALVDYMKQHTGICFVYMENGRTRLLNEDAFCRSLLRMPHATARQAWEDASQYQEKSRQNSEKTRFTP